MGLNEKIGSLEKGKQADLVVIRLDRLAQQPVTDVEAALVFSSGAHDVVKTIVAGREVYRDGQCTTVDEKELLPKLQAIANKIGNASV